ncbi:MAG: hypothetical protein IPN91_11225 [Holophagaceae bacterium]|uniref:Uncharacterized protein n=1 Tax=Candidatus Geothrix odensensis TaxID=2954440 RepID=A0A936F3M6_9BACT|nr:hypothetical protein [Candidatus Geothrix odensensis]
MSLPAMTPPPGSQLLRFVGDRVAFGLAHPAPGSAGWRAFLRTNLTRGDAMRAEMVALLGEGDRDPGGSLLARHSLG